MKTFSEWIGGDLTELSNDPFEAMPDKQLVESQLELFVNRIVGILHNLPSEQKTELVGKFVSNLKSKLS